MANVMKYEPNKPGKLDNPQSGEGKPQEGKPQEPNRDSGAGCFSTFFNGIKDLFGCLKNVEGAYTNAPPQISSHLPEQLQMPQQGSTQASAYLSIRCLTFCPTVMEGTHAC